MNEGDGTSAPKGDRSVETGDVSDSAIVTGDYNIVNNTWLGGCRLDRHESDRATLNEPEPLPLPIIARREREPDHVDREDDAARILSNVATARTVNVYGEVGIGKSYTLTHAAHQVSPEAEPDGIVVLEGLDRGRDDLLLDLYETFHRVPPGYKPGRAEIQRGLADKTALVFIDDLSLEPEDARVVLRSVSRCRVVVTSRERTISQGAARRLDALSLDDAIALMERDLERPLTSAERPAAEAIYAALNKDLGKLRLTVSATAGNGPPLGVVARQLQGEDPLAAAVEIILQSLPADELRLLTAMAPFGAARADAATVRATTGLRGVGGLLARLTRRGLVNEAPTGYKLCGVTAEDLEARFDLTEETVAALRYVASQAEAHPKEQIANLPAMLALLASAQRRGRHAEAVRFGMAISVVMVTSRRWDAWAQMLDFVLISAREIGDRNAEAWALHEMGTRRLCLGDRRGGVHRLREALAIRRQIGDRVGEEVTRHNLGEVRRRRPVGALSSRVPMLALVLIILTTVGGGAAVWVTTRSGAAPLSVVFAGDGAGKVTSIPAGIDCSSACASDFDEGAQVTLVAVPVQDSVFVGWMGAGCDGVEACTVQLLDRTSVTAEFRTVVNGGSLEVALRGDGGGTVLIAPSGIDCRALCRETFKTPTLVTLTPKAPNGVFFAGWEGAGCAGSGPCQVTVRDTMSVAAVFRQAAATRTLTISPDGQGRGRVTSFPVGIDCGASCSGMFAEGKPVKLTATALSGSLFEGWDGGGCSGTERCTVTMGTDTFVRARFRQSIDARELTVRRTGAGAGAITSSPAGIDCGASCTASFLSGAQVTLAATAQADSVFAGWTAPGCEGTGQCTIAMGANVPVVEAAFTPAAVIRTVAVGANGSGQGKITSSREEIDCGSRCTARVADGSQVTIAAAPATGSVFTGWSARECPGTAPCTITVRQDIVVRATFDAIPVYSLTVTVNGAPGTVKSPAAGISCPASCTGDFTKDTKVILSAVAPDRSVFTGWTGGKCSGTGACTVVMTGDISVGASFEPGYLLHVKIKGAGTVTVKEGSTPPKVLCLNDADSEKTCSMTFRKVPPAVLTLTASPTDPQYGVLWGDSCESGAPLAGPKYPCSVTVKSDIVVNLLIYPFG